MEKSESDQFFGFFRCCREHLFSVFLFSLIVNLLYLVPTLYMLQIYERVIPTQGLPTLVLLSLFVVVALTMLAVFDRLRAQLMVRAGLAIDVHFSEALICRSMTDPAFQQSNTMREFDRIRQFIGSPLALSIFDLVLFPVYLVASFVVHPLMGLLVLVSIGCLALMVFGFERQSRGQIVETQEITQSSYATQDQIWRFRDDIVGLGMSGRLAERIRGLRNNMILHQTGTALWASNFIAWSKFVRLCFQALTLAVGAWLAIKGSISVGAVFASTLLVSRALAPIEQILVSWRQLVGIRQSMGKVSRFFDHGEKRRTILPAPIGELSVVELTYRHQPDAPPNIENVAFMVGRGAALGIIGPNGAGKTTLLKLLAGILAPFSGTIRFDGAEMDQWTSDDRNRSIGYLPQRPSLLAGTIKENISRFDAGKIDAESVDAAVIAAAKAADAHDMILGLPGGYDFQLTNGGSNLSLGQAQWIALARSLYGSPHYLLFDEPSAHLDADSEERLLKVLRTIKASGVTMLIVTHRRRLLQETDQILVLKNGRAHALGPRDQILSAPPQPKHSVLLPVRAP